MRDHPKLPRLQHGLVRAYRALAAVHAARGEADEARRCTSQAQRIQANLMRQFPAELPVCGQTAKDLR